MEPTSPALNYSVGTPLSTRRARRILILSIFACLFGTLTALFAASVELCNHYAGKPLPFAPIKEGRHTWRTSPTNEHFWRTLKLDLANDPVWETRPLTPAEIVNYQHFRVQTKVTGVLQDLMLFSCFLYLLIGVLLIGLPILIWQAPSRGWRIALVIILLLQIGPIASIYRLEYGEAFSRLID